MDGLEDTVGKLSLSAKEWRPGQGFASSAEPARQASAGSATSAGYGEEQLERQSSWGGQFAKILFTRFGS